MKNYIKISVLILLIGVIIAAFFFTTNDRMKVGYINNKKTFDEFVYTKKLKIEYKKNVEFRKLKLDSLAYILSLLERKINSNPEKNLINEYNNRKEVFIQLTNEYQKRNEEITENYDNQILSQMNSYLKEFSKSKNIDLLLSSDDVGSVVYINKKYDFTEEAIKFINKKFNSNIK